MNEAANTTRPPARPPAVTPQEIKLSSVRELTPLEKNVRNFAFTLFALIALVTLLILFVWLRDTPAPPVLSGLTPEDQEAAIEHYKIISDTVVESATKMFELIVFKTLLPVFAAAVGFLLGKRT